MADEPDDVPPWLAAQIDDDFARIFRVTSYEQERPRDPLAKYLQQEQCNEQR
jgi:hypothetical protein